MRLPTWEPGIPARELRCSLYLSVRTLALDSDLGLSQSTSNGSVTFVSSPSPTVPYTYHLWNGEMCPVWKCVKFSGVFWCEGSNHHVRQFKVTVTLYFAHTLCFGRVHPVWRRAPVRVSSSSPGSPLTIHSHVRKVDLTIAWGSIRVQGWASCPLCVDISWALTSFARWLCQQSEVFGALSFRMNI